MARLVAYSDSTLPGLVNGAQGSYQIFPDDPNRVRIPDASFTRKDRLPGGKPADGHGRVVPDLVVEVVSPKDSAIKLHKKIRHFLDASVPSIWVVTAEARSVQVIRGDGTGVFLQEGDTLDGGDALPGLRCAVADLFEGLA